MLLVCHNGFLALSQIQPWCQGSTAYAHYFTDYSSATLAEALLIKSVVWLNWLPRLFTCCGGILVLNLSLYLCLAQMTQSYRYRNVAEIYIVKYRYNSVFKLLLKLFSRLFYIEFFLSFLSHWTLKSCPLKKGCQILIRRYAVQKQPANLSWLSN